MDRMRRMIQQQQEQQLETLNQPIVLTEEQSNEVEVDVHRTSTAISSHLDTSYESCSDQGSDRVTYYPPVFV